MKKAKRQLIFQYQKIQNYFSMGMFLHKVDNIKTKSGSSSKNFAAEVQN